MAYDWQQQWNAEVGLWWREGAGHTPPVKTAARVHPIPDAASRLLLAAQAGQLQLIDVKAVLRAIREAQRTGEGVFAGVPRWYWEEPYLSDSNAAFFAGMGLLTLWQAYREQFDKACQALLLEIYTELNRWFSKAYSEKAFYYPNKYLGDLVCGWLLTEILDAERKVVAREDSRPPLETAMLEAAAYWRDCEWGWGEHLSDVYRWVMLDQLSVLLFLSERLPDDVRAAYTALFHELLAIEDAYQGGPDVPSFRSYAFLNSPEYIDYRGRIRPLPDDITPVAAETANQALLGPTLHALGWHERVPARPAQQKDITVPCFGGVTAAAHIEDDIRLGSISRVPLMPSAEHLLWGMSWMCFPAVFWRAKGDWGFLQWATREDGRDHSHPETQVWSYIGQSLTTIVVPPMVGRTWCLQQGGNLLALRIMSPILSTWEMLCDRFRLVDGTPELTALPPTAPLTTVTATTPGRAVHQEVPVARWSQLTLAYPERIISLQCLPLSCDATPEINSRFPNTREWELCLENAALQHRRALVTLWGISLDGTVTQAPVITRGMDYLDVPRSLEERSWRIEWVWPGVTWKVCIDPLSEEPLRLISEG